jgi:tetratricopeptide (TPR) repeat protein
VACALAVLASVTIPARTALPPSDTTGLADAAKAQNRPEDELRLREQAVREEPGDPTARTRLGDALLKRGRPEEALAQFKALLAIPGLATDWYDAATRSSARAYFDMQQFDRSIEAYRAFLAATPDRPSTGARPDFHLAGTPPLQECSIRLELARALLRAGDVAGAVAECNRVNLDCAGSDDLAHKAQDGLRRIAAHEDP